MMKTDKDSVRDRFPLKNPKQPTSQFDRPNTHMEISLSYTKGSMTRTRGYVLDSTAMAVRDGMIAVTIGVDFLSMPRVMVAATTRFNARTFKDLCSKYTPHFAAFAALAEAGDREGFKAMAQAIAAGEPVQPRVILIHEVLDDAEILPRATLSVEETRARLATLTPCSPGCPGWAVMDSDSRGTEIERCDECVSNRPEGAPADYLRDDDVAQLPEAQNALARALPPATTTGARDRL